MTANPFAASCRYCKAEAYVYVATCPGCRARDVERMPKALQADAVAHMAPEMREAVEALLAARAEF